VEDLRRIKQVVRVAQLQADLLRLGLGIARNDPVDQTVAEITGILQPVVEALFQLPFEAYCRTIRFRLSPFFSISSHGIRITPFFDPMEELVAMIQNWQTLAG
jgi:hypothetical protein